MNNRLLLRFIFFMPGFFGILVVCALVNLAVAHFQSDCGLPAVLGASGCEDDIVRLGFPLSFWEQGGFADRAEFNPAAFAVDVLIALGVSGSLGLACGWVVGKR
jgi:hypothetical protein